MMGNTRRSRYGVAVLVASIALMTPIRAQEPPQRGPSEGIKVHGHWTITVRNADGTVASKTEVENGLFIGGSDMLAQILSRQRTPGSWQVQLGSSRSAILIVTEGDPAPKSLAVAYTPGVLTVPPHVTLTGSAPWPSSSENQITLITSVLFMCDSSIAPDTCRSGTSQVNFSGRGISAIAVATDQIVQFSVVITFS